jgi:hypothetical protein
MEVEVASIGNNARHPELVPTLSSIHDTIGISGSIELEKMLK